MVVLRGDREPDAEGLTYNTPFLRPALFAGLGC
jgi:hypothetical protein